MPYVPEELVAALLALIRISKRLSYIACLAAYIPEQKPILGREKEDINESMTNKERVR